MWWKRSFGSPRTTTLVRRRTGWISFHTWTASEDCGPNSGAEAMKGEAQVIERLNEALFLELGAVNQYWLHYRLLEDWGYLKLARKEREESIEEMHHADRLVERMIFLEGIRTCSRWPRCASARTSGRCSNRIWPVSTTRAPPTRP